ncbi:MAG: hypothetical protein BWY15_01683 [Firmicutes bacterium ADurb.Bin193]|nr:MAG: hypothetical protein BWY15_01683 [Firmicutes bacterium ADurb.Bin193]
MEKSEKTANSAPQTFAKWIENYWYYYKVHTITGIVILFVIIVTLVECMNRIQPDTTVSYLGNISWTDEEIRSLELEFADYIDDVNGDGIKSVFFSPFTIPDRVETPEQAALLQRAQLETIAGESFLYFMDEHYFLLFEKQGLFTDISGIVGGDEPVYAYDISASGLKMTSGDAKIYACVRALSQGDEKKEKKVAQQNNAFKILAEISKKD